MAKKDKRQDLDLTEILQVRVSKGALEQIKDAAQDGALTTAAFVRQAIYRAAGIIR